MSASSNATAIAYVELRVADISTLFVTASLKAVVSAVNRASRAL